MLLFVLFLKEQQIRIEIVCKLSQTKCCFPSLAKPTSSWPSIFNSRPGNKKNYYRCRIKHKDNICGDLVSNWWKLASSMCRIWSFGSGWSETRFASFTLVWMIFPVHSNSVIKVKDRSTKVSFSGSYFMLSSLEWPAVHGTQVVSCQFASVQGIPCTSKERSFFLATHNHPVNSAQQAPPPGSPSWLPSAPSLQLFLFCTPHPHLYHGSYQLCYNCLFTALCPPLECKLVKAMTVQFSLSSCYLLYLAQCPVYANIPQKWA